MVIEEKLDESMKLLSRHLVTHISSNCGQIHDEMIVALSKETFEDGIPKKHLPKCYSDLITVCCGVSSAWRKYKNFYIWSDFMTDEMNWLLSDEFVAFSTQIKEIHEKKKIKKAELKSFYDKTQSEIKELDFMAKAAEDKFQKWKAGQSSSKVDVD